MNDSPTAHDDIAALVPRRLWTHRADDGVCSNRGVILFADIAGFTRLTESAKVREGTRGIESLTGRINAIFSDLVTAATSHGGDILKFGGDAILVAFDIQTTDRDTISRAISCAAAMRQEIAKHRRTTMRALSLHLGLAFGRWHEVVVGRPGLRREHFVWGQAIADAMEAAEIDRGDAGINCPASLLPRGEKGQRRRIGPKQYALSLPRRWIQRGEYAPRCDLANLEPLLDFVPHALRAEKRFVPGAYSAEHRQVSTVFGFWKCPSVLCDDVRSRDLLESVFHHVHECTRANNGLWARSDPSGRKQKILVLFGALQSTTDDVDRALAFATSLQERFGQMRESAAGLKLGIGVSTSTVFTGFVGNQTRREFTAMGDGVNLAARLAAKAGTGMTLVDLATRRQATAFRFKPAGELTLKNVRKPTAVFKPVGPIEHPEDDDSDTVVEHPSAMRRCMELWETGGHSIRLSVEPGTDSHKFVAQFLARAEPSSGQSPCHVDFEPNDASLPLGGIHRFVKSAIETTGVSTGPSNELQELLDSSGARVMRILSRLGIEGAARDVARLILQQRLPSRTVVLNHVEHLGELDRRVFILLMGESPLRWLMVEKKPQASPPEAESSDAVTLGALTQDETAVVLSDILHPGRPSRSLVEFLHTRSHGVPRLARSFLSHLIAESAVSRSAGHRPVWQLHNADSVNIPDGLRAHFLQHVDRLPQVERTILRAVALLGDAAPLAAIRLLCKDVDEQSLTAGTTNLQREGLVDLHGAGSDLRVTVSDPTCRQAVYETMSHSIREAWHREAAAYWRASSQKDPGRIGEHLFRAREPSSEAWLRRAAARAQKLWSLDRARFYTRGAILAAQANFKEDYSPLLPPLSECPGASEVKLFDSFAEILRLQGLHNDAGRIHRWRARIAAQRHDIRASYHHRLAAARMDWYAGHYEKSGRQALDILRQSRRLRDRTLTAQSAYLFGETCRRTGRVAASFAALSESEALLRNGSDRQAYADALNALGLLHWNCGRLGEAHASFVRSLQELGRRGDPARRGQVANNLGILLEEQGRLRQAAHYYEKAFAVFDRSGIRRHRAYSLGNLANLHRHAARYERARAAYEEVDTELQAMGEAHAAAYTVGNLGDLARDFGQFDTARARYDAALHFALKAGDEELKAECYARQAHLHLLSGRYELMPRLLHKAQVAAKRADSREFSLCHELLRVELDLARDDFASARRRLQATESIATEVGLVLYQLWTETLGARLLIRERSARAADKRIVSAMAKAHQSGYVWWELRIAEVGCRPGLPRTLRSHCAARCQTLLREISAGIGDARVRESFSQLPLVLKVGEHLASNALDFNH